MDQIREASWSRQRTKVIGPGALVLYVWSVASSICCTSELVESQAHPRPSESELARDWYAHACGGCGDPAAGAEMWSLVVVLLLGSVRCGEWSLALGSLQLVSRLPRVCVGCVPAGPAAP